MLGAVAHAIANATGVWIKDLPSTPEKILNALKAKDKAGAPPSPTETVDIVGSKP